MENYSRVGQATEDNMVHARCVLDTKVYKYALKMCYNYRFSTATTVARIHLTVRGLEL